MTFKTAIIILFVLSTIFVSPPVSAQEQAAQIVFVPLFQDEGLTVDLYRDNTRIQVRIPMRMNTTPIRLPAGQHTFRVNMSGGQQQMIVVSEPVRLQGGRTYLVVGSGAVSDNTIVLDVIPVTWNDDTQPRLVFMHYMAENRALDLKIDGETILENIDGNTVAIQPITASTMAHFEVMNSENGNVVNEAGYEGIDIYPNLTYLAIQSRNRYLDVQPVFLDAPTIVNGGVIRPGVVSGTTLDVGTRVRYSLTLARAQNLTIALQSDADPYLRVYNANNRLIATHDDISSENLNASINAFQFAAGTYSIEIGSYADAFPGTYTLSITRVP